MAVGTNVVFCWEDTLQQRIFNTCCTFTFAFVTLIVLLLHICSHSEHVSTLTFAFSSKRHCSSAQPHRAARLFILFLYALRFFRSSSSTFRFHFDLVSVKSLHLPTQFFRSTDPQTLNRYFFPLSFIRRQQQLRSPYPWEYWVANLNPCMWHLTERN